MPVLAISVTLLSGTAFAVLAARSSAYRSQLEWGSGGMLALGFGLLGSMLPHVGYI